MISAPRERYPSDTLQQQKPNMNYACVKGLEQNIVSVLHVAQFDGVHVVSGSLDTSIRVWEVETGACRHTLMGHQSLTSGMELRNNILVSGNADSTVKVWDIVTGQCLQTLSGELDDCL
jgi:WD40 repeat protein